MLKYYRKVTRAQSESVLRVFRRDNPTLAVTSRAYRRFRRKFRNYGDYIGGEWKGMFLGIEKDGYTHS